MAFLTPESVTSAPLDASSIAYALARNACGEKLPLRDVLLGLGLAVTPALHRVLTGDVFRARYTAYLRELKDTGESFKLKARVQAEELLATQWQIIHDKDAPHATRMKGIENIVEWADLGKRKDSQNVAAPPAITINIDLGGARPEAIDVTPKITEA